MAAEKTSSIEGQQPIPALSVLKTEEKAKLVSNSLLFGASVLAIVFPFLDIAAAENWCFATNSTSGYNVQVTPASWSLLSMWILSYTWQLLWLLYAWSFVLYPRSRAISMVTLVLYIFSFLCLISIEYICLFGDKSSYLNSYSSLIFKLISAVLLWIAFGVQFKYLNYIWNKYAYTPTAIKWYDLWAVLLLVLNGLVIFATWATISAFLSFGIVLQYFVGVDEVTTGAVVIWMMTAFILIYFAVENTILDRNIRFLSLVYPVLIWALSGVMSAHWGREEPGTNPVLTLLLLLLSIILLLVRVTILKVRHLFEFTAS